MAGDGARLLADRFELFEQLGRGGAGRVLRAHDHRLDRPVAVKLLTDLGETALARFRREAAVAARIQHPNVVALHDAGVDDGTPYLVMQLVEGPSLADRVAAEGPLGHEEVRQLARDLLAGLEATHRAGVLHRDLTPRNVLFDRHGTALLADFGIARGSDDPTLTAAHTVVGTRPFLAPERLRGNAATQATDLFAVGVTLQVAATGRHDLPVPRDHPLAPLVTACTAPDPHARPADARAAIDRLRALGGTDDELGTTEAIDAEAATTDEVAPAGAPAAAGPPTGPRTSDRRRTLVLGGIAVVALVGAVIAFSGNGETPDPGAAEPSPTAPAAEDPPGFDPEDPAGSARDLASWLRDRS